MEFLWARPEPGQRRPRLSRDDIARAAVRIADSEGIDAVSMRRIAGELNAGTMTLYHYVSTKAELFTLVTDAVIGENIVPDDELPADWRGAIVAIAHRTRAALARHPWVFDVVDQPGVGPNGVRHFEQSMRALDGLGLSLTDRLDIIGAVDEYTFGYCLHDRETTRADDGGGGVNFDEIFEYLRSMIESGAFPSLAALVHEQDMQSVWDQIEHHHRDATRFERNLQRLLDGIELSLFQR